MKQHKAPKDIQRLCTLLNKDVIQYMLRSKKKPKQK